MMRWQHAHRELSRRSEAVPEPAVINVPAPANNEDPVASLLADNLAEFSHPHTHQWELRQDVFGSGPGGSDSGSSSGSSGSSGSGSSSSSSGGSGSSGSGSDSSSGSSSSSSDDSSSSTDSGGATYNTDVPKSDSTNGNTKDASGVSSNTLAIVLGVVIPCLVAAVLFIVVIQKHRKRERADAARDKHHSLDFGMGEVHRGKKGKKGRNNLPEMTFTGADGEKGLHGKGLSMDLNSLGSPYVIADLKGKASFDSSARSIHDDADPYRPVRTASKSPSPPNTRARPADSQSTKDEKQGLLNGAATPSNNTPRSASPVNMPAPAYNGNSVSRKPLDTKSPPPLPPKPEDPKPASNFSIPRNIDRSSISSKSNIDGGRKSPPPPLPPAPKDMHSDGLESYNTYTDMLGISQGPQNPHEGEPPAPPPKSQARERSPNNLNVPLYNDPRRLSGSMRPLPPSNPTDDAEQRANRIRSFYKEYFDDSRPAGEGEGEDDYYGYGGYGDYYGDEYGDYDPNATWDPAIGEFVTPHAPYGEPITRGAMTPPPRGPPRFRGAPGGHRYTSSSGHSHGPRGRAHSSASGRPGARGRPVKKLPPPKPLNNLPTPHLLKDDLTSLPAMEFAPPMPLRDRVAGRSMSPSLEQRPYSPSVRAFTPLKGSHTELAVMPSPHALRKSGTFTGLDFAPPPRINADGGGSDVASIRSGRSGISAVNAHNVRAGNYRLSRVGNQNVGTKDDLAAVLKPRWDLNR